MKSFIRNPKIRLWFPPFIGFLAYGSWAFFVNYGYGVEVSIRSALVQGSYSFAITLVLTATVEWLFTRLQNMLGCNIGNSLVIFVAVVLLLTMTSTVVNLLAGTPNIFWTILPGLILSAVYTALHLFALHKIACSIK